MNYFGTSLTDHGHFMWELQETSMRMLGIDFRSLPFNPEELTNNLLKGEVIYYQCRAYTVIGIAGSCKDERNGTKSIFWVHENITFGEMKERILSTPMAKQIIDKMAFEINWGFY